MRKTCDEVAAHGFIAVRPDLFWRQEPGLDLNNWSEAEWKKGLALTPPMKYTLSINA
jgi:carboxymethylenebutenolidase